MNDSDFYFSTIVAAFVRGKLQEEPSLVERYQALFQTPLAALTIAEAGTLIEIGKGANLRLHKFKRTMELARVQRVLGILKGLAPTELLDVGSGRGTFLWSCLDAFPELAVMAIDREERRVADILAVRAGGVQQLSAEQMDATSLSFADRSFDVVTLLEVLEHIPTPQAALNEVVRVAKRFAIASVPSKPDDNPEHLHVFSAEHLGRMLEEAGAVRVRFESVLNHLIAIAKVAN